MQLINDFSFKEQATNNYKEVEGPTLSGKEATSEAENGDGDDASGQASTEDGVNRAVRSSEEGIWLCSICKQSGRMSHHLRSSEECLKQLRAQTKYQFKGAERSEIFITKFCLANGVCPNALCTDVLHSSIPRPCFDWWMSNGWQYMGWRGSKEEADVNIIKEKIREFTKYHKKKVRSTEEQRETISSTTVQESQVRCSKCSEEGDLIQHLVISSQCRKAYVNKFLSGEELDVRNSVFQLGIVLNMCVRFDCAEKTNFTYLGPHLKNNSECLLFYQNEGVYLSIPNWKKDTSPALISKMIAQLRRKIAASKEKERACGSVNLKKELSQLFTHVCCCCGAMGPSLGEEFSLKVGCADEYADPAWYCSHCSESSLEYSEFKQQLQEKTERLKGARGSLSSDVEVSRCLASGRLILTPVCLLPEDGQSIPQFAPSLSTQVLVPYDTSALREIKGWVEEIFPDKDEIQVCVQELMRRPIIANFGATVSCLYRGVLANVRQTMGKVLFGLSKVTRGEILSLNPPRTSARKTGPNLEQTMGSAMRDRLGWSFNCEEQKMMDSEARCNVNGQVRIYIRGTILRKFEDEDLLRILLIGCQAFVNPNIKTTEELLSDPNFETFFISMTPVVLTFIRNKVALFVKHIVIPNFEHHDLQLLVDDSELLVEIHGYVYAKQYEEANKILAANPQLESNIELIDHVEREEQCLPTTTLNWEKLSAAYNLGEIPAKAIIQVAKRCQVGNTVWPLSMLNLRTSCSWQITEKEKALRARAVELSHERGADEDVAEAIIEIAQVLHDEGLFEELASEEIDSDVRRSIRRRLVELCPNLPIESINALQWYHTLLMRTGGRNRWTLKRGCGDTLVKPYSPLLLEALQQEVEVEVVIGRGHLEPERRTDLELLSGASTASSAWKRISILKFLHGVSKYQEPASQSTVAVIVSQEEGLTFSEATEKDEECDKVFFNSLNEGFVVNNGDLRKQYPLRPAAVEELTFAQFAVNFYTKKARQPATFDSVTGVGADSEELIVGGEFKVPMAMRLSNQVILKKRIGKSKPVPLLLSSNYLDSYGERLLFGAWRSLDDVHVKQSDADKERLRRNRLELFPYAVFPGCDDVQQ